ncbi:putative laccase-9 [Morella rubra]|nr:putative laccase-9 [Morella rubra]
MSAPSGFLGLLLLILGMFLGWVNGEVHYYDFVLKETNFTRLCSSKSMLVVNDSLPGPVIRATKGDTVFVNVQNQGDYGVTIHWHGVHQPRNPWSDGPEYITQCPIEAGANFTYEIIFSDEEGTLWWHAHSDWTRAGVHGAIVVLPLNETGFPFPQPDGEVIVVLGSWYKGDVNEEVAEDLESGADTPRSDCYVINGQPGDFLPCSSDSTYRWQVDYGKTYLLRLVNAAMNAELFFAIAQHNLTLVGLDGSYVKPVVSDSLMITPGQTMDILVTANQPLGRYYMATRQYDSVRPDDTDYDHTNATAILEYRGNYTPSAAPIFPSSLPIYDDFNSAVTFTKRLRSLADDDHPVDIPKNITTRMYIVVAMNSIEFDYEGETQNSLSSSLNNVSWINPSTDVLLAYYRNMSGVYTPDFPDYPPNFYNFTSDDVPDYTAETVQGTRLKVLNYNEEVEIVFQGTTVLDASEDHPMHLHGYTFYVVGSGFGNFDNVSDPETYNLVDPPKMNTVSLPKKGWVALRFRASNPGVWLWHCHLDRHLSWGMNTVFILVPVLSHLCEIFPVKIIQLKEANFTRLCSSKSMLVVNDSFPGPVIRVTKGDTAYVNVHNQGDYGVTIHWHGVHQPRNPWSDGPEYITQCPIEAGANFTYEITLSDEEGTLWWHAHSDWTRAGVHGAIVVLPSNETGFPFPQPDGEEIVVLGSWYKGDVNEEVAEDLESGADTPRSDCYVINGQPGDFLPCSSDSTYRWQVDYGRTYLLRLVNAAMNAELFFAIAQHNLTLVGLDGSYVKPVVSDSLMITPGQTMDILVTANQPLGRYYMATRQYDSTRPDVTDYDQTNVTAILEYRGNYTPSAAPIFPSSLPIYDDFNSAVTFTKRLRSLADNDHPVDIPKNITTRMYITVTMNTVEFDYEGETKTALASSLNNVSWINPSTDVLLAYYRNISGVYTPDFPDYPPNFYNFTSDDMPDYTTETVQGTRLKVLNYNEEVEIVFQGTNVFDASEDHPMHLHGYTFYVVGSGVGNFDNVSDPETYNLVDPPKMNTVSLPKKGWVALRFRASNPGVWLWHCHLDRHLSWGMDTVFIYRHGVHQPRNPWSDGPEYITQCPIEPGSNFTYEVIFSIEEGTLWWHAHSDWTRASVYGAIVVLPNYNTGYPFPQPDGEEIILLGSWYNTGDVNEEVAEDLKNGIRPPRSDAYTINGQPGDFYACSNKSTHRWQVDYGKTYLLRLVNAAMNEEFYFAMAQHNLTVVGVDGAYIKPTVTGFVMITTGQTMDILVTANQPLGRYYMAAGKYDSVIGNHKPHPTAVLEYKGRHNPSLNPIFPSSLPNYKEFNSAINFMNRLRSLASQDHPVNVPKNITRTMYVAVSANNIVFDREGTRRTVLGASLNNVSWVYPSTDVLLAYYRNISGFYTTDFPDYPPHFFNFTAQEMPDVGNMTVQATKVTMLDYNEEVEIVFQGTNLLDASVDHPMHLHGYTFYVVGSGFGNFDNETDPEGYNLVDPPKMNTVSLPKNGWVVIRFKASNPGVWLWHCHFESHLSWGMASVIVVRNGGTTETSIREPPPYLPSCKGKIYTCDIHVFGMICPFITLLIADWSHSRRHGVHQPRNPWSDGPEYITQCPIEPGSNFTYEVIFSDEEGTLWWHAHSDWTRAGVHGAIVVFPLNETGFPFPQPDGEEIVVLGSWYESDVNKEVAEDLKDGTTPPHSDSYTINGQPGDFLPCSNESTYRWKVDYGKTYLVRLVNAVMNVEMYFAVARHNLTVVGSMGHTLSP